ncbi:MAG TPA: pyridoxamine 5'-phosphate oxidase family protein [Deltaproteobacteria bacterium]|nr:pyridoxamine 5'-phosphate oxidase family protein [Deltaproteobacteria bacterium]
MQEFIKNNRFCVLATVSGTFPHCCLMSYVTDEEFRDIYMVTKRNTKKYQNLTKKSFREPFD